MAAQLNFPTFASLLPNLNSFIKMLPLEFEARRIVSWQEMTDKAQAFFTTKQMEQVEDVTPGWQTMSAYAEGLTRTHVMCVFTGLLLSPEYQNATPAQQELMKWIVLLHDIAKIAEPGFRDNTHGFRSAVEAATILPKLGFEFTNLYPAQFESWARLTATATTCPPGSQHDIQDNGKLPEIHKGVTALFGHNSPTALVIVTVLLHMSLNVINEWPQAAPLNNTDIKRYITPDLYPLLKMMMLADNDGWVIFEPALKAQYRQETLAAFDHVQVIIES